MATDRPTAPDGFSKPDLDGDDDERPRIELEPGDVLTGTVLTVRTGSNDNGDWYDLHVKDVERGVVRYYAKGEAKRAARAGEIDDGTDVWVYCDPDDERSFTREDDGKTVTYHKTVCEVR
jgi:hypothetical protein